MLKNPTKPQGKTLCEIFMELTPNSMRTHTPGPWHITKDTTRGEFVTYTKVRDQHDGVVAIMSTMNEDANAQLIAAAPTMLRALQGILAIRPDYHAGKDDLWLNRGEVERIAKEVIAMVESPLL